MKLHEALALNLPLKRYFNSIWIDDIEDSILSKEDILADDWETKRVVKTSHIFKSSGGTTFTIKKCESNSDPLYLEIRDNDEDGVSFTEEDVDIILDVIMNTTETGKSRIIPF